MKQIRVFGLLLMLLAGACEHKNKLDPTYEPEPEPTVEPQPQEPLGPKLTVAITGTGYLLMGSQPEGLRCDSTCEVFFPQNTEVRFRLLKEGRHTFLKKLSGACTDFDAECVIKMDADKTLNIEIEDVNFDGHWIGQTSQDKPIDILVVDNKIDHTMLDFIADDGDCKILMNGATWREEPKPAIYEDYTLESIYLSCKFDPITNNVSGQIHFSQPMTGCSSTIHQVNTSATFQAHRM